MASAKIVYSKVSVKSQTVLPAEVRERLQISPGDRVRYVLDDKGVSIEKAELVGDDDPFLAFTEWGTRDDDDAYADL